MIDIENKVIDTVYNAVKAAFPVEQYPDLSFYSEAVEAPDSFPCVVLVQEDNYTYRPTQDNELNEHHASLMFSVNVYSNKIDSHKEEAKAIFQVVDETMQSMRFTRVMASPMPNIDRTIYRIAGRYEAIVGRPQSTGDDTEYQMYRRR